MTRDAGMRSYYDARAAEYDDWWLGTGLFADRDRPGWHEEVGALVAVLRAMRPARTLDVACGTGFLTRHLPGEVTGLDQSPAMRRVAAARGLDVVDGDGLALPFGDGAFERLFTSHFYGHLARDERAAFLTEASRVARELVVVDSALRPGVEPEEQQTRTLDDGSRHAVYKRFFTPGELAGELGGGEALYAGTWFVAVAGATPRAADSGSAPSQVPSAP